ncbi:MAG: class II aldolase/adducin family protein [Actinomycetota bacterium]|nr:class II aldolase/adducin family protein [Actinomycetota bacterium]
MLDDVLATAHDLYRLRLVEGTAGNVSARLSEEIVCVTPSGLSYEEMTVDDLVVVDLAGVVVSGRRPPTSELALHLACYRTFTEVGGVVHSHPPEASAFAAAGRSLPVPVDEFALYVGGEVPVAAYAPSGSPELGRHAAAVLGQVGAALLANHGLVAVGSGPRDALQVSALVEKAARIVRVALELGGLVPLPGHVLAGCARSYRERRARWRPIAPAALREAEPMS